MKAQLFLQMLCRFPRQNHFRQPLQQHQQLLQFLLPFLFLHLQLFLRQFPLLRLPAPSARPRLKERLFLTMTKACRHRSVHPSAFLHLLKSRQSKNRQNPFYPFSHPENKKVIFWKIFRTLKCLRQPMRSENLYFPSWEATQ